MKQMLRLSLVIPAILTIALLSTLSAPRPASAHPMGDFTVNRYSALTIHEDRVELLYIVDMAEIPTFQELGKVSDTDGARSRPEEVVSQQEREAYVRSKSVEITERLTLQVDGRSLTPSLQSGSLTFPPGNKGLPTLRLELRFLAPLYGARGGELYYRDDNFANKIGWKEIIARAGEGVMLAESSVPAVDVTRELTSYNLDATSSAPLLDEASVKFKPGLVGAPPSVPAQSQTVPQVNAGGMFSWAQEQGNTLGDLLRRDQLPLDILIVGLLVAFGLGAGHALSPGHGKTVVAAYLVGSRGTPLHAAVLGLTVTISHTIGVFLLGTVVLFAQDYILPEAVYPWISFASGLLLAVLGIVLFVQRFRFWRAVKQAESRSHSHTHHFHTEDELHDHADHSDHNHYHEHFHAHSHGALGKPHSHLPPDGQRVTLGSLLALGITGGIIPCPSALVVLLLAISLNKVLLGLGLIVAFSMGLALVLTAIGLLLVYGRSLAGRIRFNAGLLARLPMASALMVCCLGLLIAFQSVYAR